MLGFALMVVGMFTSAKASTKAISSFINYVDSQLNKQGAFTCKIKLLGSDLEINHKEHRKIAQSFFDICALGETVKLVPEMRLIRIYLFSECLIYGKAVDSLPNEYMSAYPEFKEKFLMETRRIWKLNHRAVFPFLNILKMNNCKGFTLPSEEELFSKE